MKAVVVTNERVLEDVELALPRPEATDVCVRVMAISVNPVDTKQRRHGPIDGGQRVLGWDAVGTVVACGERVHGFTPGDRVWYAGALDRPGSNAEYQCVDHRLVSHAPQTLSDAEAAALPLTALTAWELVFDRLRIVEESQGNVLVVGAAGGVGSILVQLLRTRTRCTVIGTASRPESSAWVREMGAHHVVSHRGDMVAAVRGLGIAGVDQVISLTGTGEHLDAIVELLRPQGQLALIDDPVGVDITKLKRKSLSLHWEFMYTRSLYDTDDCAEQGRILAAVAELVDGGRLRSTWRADFGTINAKNLSRAHAQLESGTTLGKITLSGFADDAESANRVVQ